MKNFFIISFFAIVLVVPCAAQISYDEDLDSIHHWGPLATPELLFNGRTFIVRDDDGKAIQALSLTSYMGGPWDNSNLLALSYNDQDLLEQQVVFGWYDTIWVSWFKTNFGYDSIGNLILIYDSTFRRANTYDNSNKLISSVDTRWEEDEWVDKEWTTYSYKDSGLLEIKHQLTHLGGAIYDESRIVYEYDPDGRILRERVQNPLGGGLWDDFARTVYTYDEFTTTEVVQHFSFQQWLNSLRTIYTYNPEEKVTNQVSQSWVETHWMTYDSAIYYYSIETGLNVLPAERFIVYPNPVNQTLQFEFDESEIHQGKLFIYSANGIEMKSMNIDEAKANSIDVSQLNPGIYYLLIRTSIGQYSKPFVKQ